MFFQWDSKILSEDTNKKNPVCFFISRQRACKLAYPPGGLNLYYQYNPLSPDYFLISTIFYLLFSTFFTDGFIHYCNFNEPKTAFTGLHAWVDHGLAGTGKYPII